MTFDKHGNLFPHELMEMDLQTFKEKFVGNFASSERRATIFESYLKYVDTLKSNLRNPFQQWIDGSFVSSKLNPNDIDLVTFVDFKDYIENEKLLSELKKVRFDKGSIIDAYFVITYPKSHPKCFLYEMDQKQWLFTFGFSRNKRPKGLVQINF